MLEGRPGYVDTATVYGVGEGRINPLLGRCLADTGAPVAVVNKIGSDLVDGPDLGRRAVEEYRRGLDEIGRADAVLVHLAGPAWLERDLALHEAVRRDGRPFGICTNRLDVLELYAGRMKIDVLQVAVNLLDARAARPVLGEARRRGIQVMARSALASGLLGGRYGPEDAEGFTDDLRRRYAVSRESRAVYAERMAKVAGIRAHYEALAASGRFRGSLAAFAYAAVRRLPGVDTIVLGGSTEAQLRENLAWSAEALDPAAAAEIAERIDDWAAPYL